MKKNKKKQLDISYLKTPVFKENEYDANKKLSKGCVLTGVALMVLVGIFIIYLFISGKYKNLSNQITNFISIPLILILLFSCNHWGKTEKIKDSNFKYFLLTLFIFAVAAMNIFFPKHGIIGWSCCIVVASFYYSPKTLRYAYFVSLFCMLICLYLGMLCGEADYNLLGTEGILYQDIDGVQTTYLSIGGQYFAEDAMSFVDRFKFLMEHPNRLWQVFVYYYLTRSCLITLLYVLCGTLSQRTLVLLKSKADDAAVEEKRASELSMATSIQANVLPKKFISSDKFQLYALMEPAKEVGGDFYDFFLIDDNHLALVIADVSGKGVPAALFMMKAETTIKTLVYSYKEDTAAIMQRANKALCEGNVMEMFVTCWLGILNLNTGVLKYTSAGHNPPLIQNGEQFTYLKSKVGLVLGAMDFSKYKENTITLNRGGKIFLYTDGVTEAHNINNELYGESRLENYLNNIKSNSAEEVVKELRKDIRDFAGEAPQFDDITMLAVELKNYVAVEKVFNADTKEMDNVNAFVEKFAKDIEMPNKILNTLKICLEELFVNVASYAYQDKKGQVTLSISKGDDKLTFILSDEGVPFNPLAKEDPDISLDASERSIGGLGIFMVKKMMDNVNYQRIDNKNIFTMEKIIK